MSLDDSVPSASASASVSASPAFSTPFTPEYFTHLQSSFGLFDFTSTGSISSNDIGSLIRALGFNLTEERIQRSINQFDRTGDGKLDFPTFHSILNEIQYEIHNGINHKNKQNNNQNNELLRYQLNTTEELLEKFHYFDLRGTGELHIEELLNLLRNYGEPLSIEDCNHLLKEIEINGDSMISIKKFIEIIQNSSIQPDGLYQKEFSSGKLINYNNNNNNNQDNEDNEENEENSGDDEKVERNENNELEELPAENTGLSV